MAKVYLIVVEVVHQQTTQVVFDVNRRCWVHCSTVTLLVHRMGDSFEQVFALVDMPFSTVLPRYHWTVGAEIHTHSHLKLVEAQWRNP